MHATARVGPFALSLLALVCCGCSTGHYAPFTAPPDPAEVGARFLTHLDLLAAGHSAALAWVAGLPPAEREAARSAIRAAEQASVRMLVVIETGGAHFSLERGSGVLIGEKGANALWVGTSGHLLDGPTSELRMMTSAGVELVRSGARQEHVATGTSDQDWGLVELVAPVAGLTGLPIAMPRAGEIAFVLGYPGGVGRACDGRLVQSNALEQRPLAPLLAVGKVVDVAPLWLRPLAGGEPSGGMSGGAIVNHNGELIGLFNAVVTTQDGGGMTYWLTGASTAALPEVGAR